jgi:O-methyltransferase involved in polyketide biosynthesis
MNKKAESPHRHISFTAHYTGYIWYQMGLSHPVLASRKGERLAALMHPLELLMERFVGGSMRSTLKQRHALIDRQLNRLMAQYPNLQVLEIAAGLSPRGWRYRFGNPLMTYVEADLPAMADAKRQALSSIEQPAPRIEAADLFTDDLGRLLESFDPDQPLVIISEGLVNYFTKDMLATLWSTLAQGLARFPVGIYLTDIYPEPVHHRLGQLIWNSSKLLKCLSKSAFSFHFISAADASAFFAQQGFAQIDVFQPQDDDNSSHQNHLGDLVWVIESRV